MHIIQLLWEFHNYTSNLTLIAGYDISHYQNKFNISITLIQ